MLVGPDKRKAQKTNIEPCFPRKQDSGDLAELYVHQLLWNVQGWMRFRPWVRGRACGLNAFAAVTNSTTEVLHWEAPGDRQCQADGETFRVALTLWAAAPPELPNAIPIVPFPFSSY